MSKFLEDKVRVAKGLNCLGLAYVAKGNYKESFTLYKRALRILEENKSPETESAIYNNLGIIYESFGQYSLAEEYYSLSIEILEKIESTLKEKFLNHTFVNLGIIYRHQGAYEKSLKYIKKAITILETSDIDIREKKFRDARALMEKGMTYLAMGKLTIAKELFFSNYAIVERYGETLSTAEAYYYLGSLYKEKAEYKDSIKYLLEALDLIHSIKSHQLKVDILVNLASIYKIVDQPEKAFEYLRRGTVLKDSIFGAQNTWSIYEVKESYEKEKQQQELILIQKEKKIDVIIKGIYLSGAFLISLLGLLYFKYLRTKHKKEKKIIEKEKRITELELSKTKDILNIKNKELTTSTLQIIENGELIKQFKKDIQEIKKELDKKYHFKLDRLSTSMHNNSKNNWEEFKLRFEQVNTGFFEKLKKDYPTLSPTDLKLCSFLKLNFNTKDIANLMGISDKSVKMNRYRLRKKFNLSRDVNLTDFVSKF